MGRTLLPSCWCLHTGAFMVLPESNLSNQWRFFLQLSGRMCNPSLKAPTNVPVQFIISSISPIGPQALKLNQECVIGNTEPLNWLIAAGAACILLMYCWFCGKRMSLWCSKKKAVSTQESPVPYQCTKSFKCVFIISSKSDGNMTILIKPRYFAMETNLYFKEKYYRSHFVCDITLLLHFGTMAEMSFKETFWDIVSRKTTLTTTPVPLSLPPIFLPLLLLILKNENR